MLYDKMPYLAVANLLNVLTMGLVLLKVTLKYWILLVFMGNPRTPNMSTYLITRVKCCLRVSASHSSACEVFSSRFSWWSLLPCAQHLWWLKQLVMQTPHWCGLLCWTRNFDLVVCEVHVWIFWCNFETFEILLSCIWAKYALPSPSDQILCT